MQKKTHDKAFSELKFTDGTLIQAILPERKLNKNNTSGVKGVAFDAKRRLYIAQIQFKRKKYLLGRFKNFEDAVAARKKGEETIFGKFLSEFNNEG
jgi:hypothetical protein